LIGLRAPLASETLSAANQSLEAGFGRDELVSSVDRGLIEAALNGFGYDNSINLTTTEARRLGAAIGCDFFIVGKSEVLSRSDRVGESHEEAYAAIMIVDSRSGRLALFDFVNAKAPTRAGAIHSLTDELAKRTNGYVERIVRFYTIASSVKDTGDRSAATEPIEDVPEENSTRAEGFKPPEFLNRIKPEYTAEAQLADVTATVEALAVFRSNGEVGEVEITRWAGFGLDESSERTIRRLKFKPATRDGRPISVRAAIRYNFRRVAEPAARPGSPDQPTPPRSQSYSKAIH
jgi:hypothetical protein